MRVKTWVSIQRIAIAWIDLILHFSLVYLVMMSARRSIYPRPPWARLSCRLDPHQTPFTLTIRVTCGDRTPRRQVLKIADDFCPTPATPQVNVKEASCTQFIAGIDVRPYAKGELGFASLDAEHTAAYRSHDTRTTWVVGGNLNIAPGIVCGHAPITPMTASLVT